MSSGMDDVADFEVAFDPIAIDDLRRRLRSTRWAEQETVNDWSQGVPLEFVQELAAHWLDDYDFDAATRRMNEWPQFTTRIDDLDIHFVHARSREPDVLPLVITHGWPGNVRRVPRRDRAPHRPRRPWWRSKRCLFRRVPVATRLRVQRQAETTRARGTVGRRRVGHVDVPARL